MKTFCGSMIHLVIFTVCFNLMNNYNPYAGGVVFGMFAMYWIDGARMLYRENLKLQGLLDDVVPFVLPPDGTIIIKPKQKGE